MTASHLEVKENCTRQQRGSSVYTAVHGLLTALVGAKDISPVAGLEVAAGLH